MKRFGCLLMTLMIALSAAPALASSAGELLSGPMEITLRDLQMDAFMPLDEERLGELNSMLGHVSLRLVTGVENGTTWSGLTALVDDHTVADAWIGEGEDGALLALPGIGTLYAAQSLGAVDGLLGTSSASVSAMMVPEVFLEDAEAMVCALFGSEEYASVKNETNTIKDTNNTGYGRAVTRRTLTPMTGSQLRQVLLNTCPEGPLRALIASVNITLTDAAGVYALCKADGKPAKVVFRAQITDSLGRVVQVDIEWKLRRDDPKLPERDHLSLTLSGDVAGSFEFRLTRQTETSGSVNVTYDIYSWAFEGFTLARSTGRKAQMGWARDAAGHITGALDMTVSGSPRINLSLTLNLDASGPLSGEVSFAMDGDQSLRGTAVIAPLSGSLTPPQGEAVPLPEETALREAIVQECRDYVASMLVARLVLLEDQADTAYLRRGLSDETWEEIAAAARQLTDETEGEE